MDKDVSRGGDKRWIFFIYETRLMEKHTTVVVQTLDDRIETLEISGNCCDQMFQQRDNRHPR